MRRILILIAVLIFVIPFHAGADEPSSEDQRIAGIDRALKATVKIQPNSTNIADSASQGSGFFVSTNMVLSNWHVVNKSADSLRITRYDGSMCQGSTTYRDEGADLALVMVDCEGVPLPLAQSALLGQDAYAIGNAYVDFAVTSGIVTKLDDLGFLVTDAHVNHGNSGGPLINSTGEVIGVVKGILIADEAYTYVIPISKVKSFIQWSGVDYSGIVSSNPR